MNIHVAKDLRLVPIEELLPYEKNARTHSPEQIDQIAASMQEFGFTNPILIDGARGIIAGHGRLAAAKKLNITHIPIIELSHLTDAQKRAYIIADNKLALNAGWDDAVLAAEIEQLKNEDFDIELLGFTDEELADLLPETEDLPPGDPEEAPEPMADPKVVRGEVYILGGHRLMCGDSTVLTDVEKLMDGQKADMVWTDPPYNVAYEGKTKDALTIENDSMGDADFYKFLYDVYVNLLTATKAGGSIYVAHADSEGANFRKAMADAGWLLKQCLIWVKQSLVMGRQDYHWKHEPILYGWAPGESHNWYTDRKQTTVLNFDRPSRNGEHPTMKPVKLVEYMIGNSSRSGETVLDLFGGSGTTMIACEGLNRKARLMELDPRYCGVILDRWELFTGKKACREDGTPWSEIKSK